jgi:hypothetical protein
MYTVVRSITRYIRGQKKMLLRVVLPFALILAVSVIGLQLLQNSHASAPCTVSAKLENSCRPWLGAWANGYTQAGTGVRNQITYHEQRVGRQVELVKDYRNGGAGLSADDKYYISRPGTYVVITWKPGSDFSSAGGGNTTINSNIDAMADAAKSVAPRKFFLSVWHEPENDVSPGTSACSTSGNAGSPAQYRQMWQNVRNRFDAKGVNNVVWTQIPMGYSGWQCMEKDLWPGNNLIDWIMWDPYGQSDKSTWDGQIGSYYKWMSANSDAAHAFTSKVWGIAETSTHLSSKASSVAYWNGAKAALDGNKFPKIKAYIVFDSDAGKPDNRIMYWCDPATAGGVVNNHSTCGHLETDTNEQNAYKAFANDPRFTDAFYNTVTPPGDTIRPTVSASVAPATLQVNGSVTATAAANDNVGVTKVEFYSDGVLVGAADTSAPYTATWAMTSTGTKVVTAKAYDAAGNVASSSPVNVTVTPTPPVGILGDVDGDHRVWNLDYGVLVGHLGQNFPSADFDRDGIVGASDLALQLQNWTW